MMDAQRGNFFALLGVVEGGEMGGKRKIYLSN